MIHIIHLLLSVLGNHSIKSGSIGFLCLAFSVNAWADGVVRINASQFAVACVGMGSGLGKTGSSTEPGKPVVLSGSGSGVMVSAMVNGDGSYTLRITNIMTGYSINPTFFGPPSGGDGRLDIVPCPPLKGSAGSGTQVPALVPPDPEAEPPAPKKAKKKPATTTPGGGANAERAEGINSISKDKLDEMFEEMQGMSEGKYDPTN